jgi:hypothetical protein
VANDEALNSGSITALKELEDQSGNLPGYSLIAFGSEMPHRAVLAQSRVQTHQKGVLAGLWDAQQELIPFERCRLHVLYDGGNARITLVERTKLRFRRQLWMVRTNDAYEAPARPDDIRKMA